jgi:hypothetical protein
VRDIPAWALFVVLVVVLDAVLAWWIAGLAGILVAAVIAASAIVVGLVLLVELFADSGW